MVSSRVLFAILAMTALVGTAWAAGMAGERDAAFGTDGIVTYDDVGARVITADDGYLGLGSLAPTGGGFTQWVLYRFEEDGSRDTSFGGGDGATTPLFGAERDDRANAVLEAPDGRIFVAGDVSTATVSGKGKRATVTYDRDMVVACFESDGDLDLSLIHI